MSDRHAVAWALRALAAENDGRLTPEAVVTAAADENSPMHDHFTWDDARAAAERRLDQARTLIRTVKVEITTTHYSLKVPQFVRDPSLPAKEAGYISVARLRTDEDMAREALVSEFARASAALSRAKALAMALGMSEEVAEMAQGVEALAARVRSANETSAEAPAN